MNLFAGTEWRHRYQNRFVNTVVESKGGANSESNIDVYTQFVCTVVVRSCYITKGA